MYRTYFRISGRYLQCLPRCPPSCPPARSSSLAPRLPCTRAHTRPRRNFADAIECVRGSAGRVVAVTSPEKAGKVLEEKPGFWELKKVL